ncbi:MAG: hypothetical protein KJP00_10330 [Bacteroidia bacterium]|nr:hypothetical protein [Bacteroidia bacterium]
MVQKVNKLKYQIRPRFEIEADMTMDELAEKLKKGLGQIDSPVKGQVHPTYASLRIPRKDQHYWSPQLSLTMDEFEKGCLIRGMYGPNPQVWTMFVFFYAIIAFAVMVIAIVGFSNRSLGNAAPILWLLPVLLLIFSSLYATSYFGQKKGEDQMHTLKDFFESSTGLSTRSDTD